MLLPLARSNAIARPTANARAAGQQFEMVRGHERVLQWQSRLQMLADTTGQKGLVDALPMHLSIRYFGSKIPHLLVQTATNGELEAAVLLHEYVMFHLHTGCFIPADIEGRWTVLAPEAKRRSVARQAAAFLMERGGRLVLLSVLDADFAAESAPQPPAGLPLRFGTQTRVLRRSLQLAGTLEETLASFGKRTRRNFRAYRRHAESDFQLRYVDCPVIDAEQFAQLAAESGYPIPRWVADWRMRMLREIPGAFATALYAEGWGYISMVGGRRCGATSIVDWQANTRELADYSLSTVMRSYLIEAEIARGATSLRFQDGTSHSMQSAFADDKVGDLLVVRPLLSTHTVQRLLRRILPEGNLLSEVVAWDSLTWH